MLAQVEIIIIVLMYKILYPENVIMNRGNHEALDLNRVYGFGAEVPTPPLSALCSDEVSCWFEI